MKTFKTCITARLAALLFGAALFGLAPPSALAAGTAINTSITNTATLAYSVSGVGQTPVTGTSTAFVVDAKINLSVTGGATTNVIPGATTPATATTFSVTNSSNTALDFNLTVVDVIAGDNFDPTACAAYVEDGTTPGTYQAAQDTLTFIDELAVDTSINVYVVCSIPGTATDTQTGLVGLVATARGDFTGANNTYAPTTAPAALGAAITETAGADTSTAVDIVFADDLPPGTPGADDTVDTGNGAGVRNAAASARNTYLISITVPTVTKTATLLCDPLNGLPGAGAKRIPGAMVQWTIVINNPAATAITLTTISDTLTNLTLDPGQAAGLTAPASAATCIAGPGTYGFKVTPSAIREMGGSASAAGQDALSYFTSGAADADGVDIAGSVITATFATIFPVDAVYGTAAGELPAGASVTIDFVTTLN